MITHMEYDNQICDMNVLPIRTKNPVADEEMYEHYLKTKDEADIRSLLERYRESLTLFLFGLVGNMEDAEDIMMETFALVALGKTPFLGISSFKTWLFAIARNKAKMFIRKYGKEVETASQRKDDINVTCLEDGILSKERNKVVYEALNSLRPDYANVLYLYYIENMKHESIAKILGKTKKQTYDILYEGRNALKHVLEGMDYEF